MAAKHAVTSDSSRPSDATEKRLDRVVARTTDLSREVVRLEHARAAYATTLAIARKLEIRRRASKRAR